MPNRQQRNRNRNAAYRPPASPQARPEVTVHLDDMANEGQALGRVEGKVAFAAFGIPGEDVRLRVFTDKKQFLSGDVIEVLTSSPHRVTPRCPHFGVCGGCQLQHVSYEQQLVLKRRVVEEAVRRIGKLLDVTVHPTLPSRDPWQYRNHARFSVTREGSAGFTHRNSHRFVPIDWCYIVHPWINKAKDALQGAAAGSHQLDLRIGWNTGEYIVQPALEGDTRGFETGQESFTEVLGGVAFKVSAPSFFQVNTPQAERLVAIVRDRLGMRGTDTLVDAYAGVGVFAVLLAPFVSKVIAIEESHSAIEDALANVQGYPHIQVIEGKTEDILPKLDVPADLVVLDPPRAGCFPQVLDALAVAKPRKVAYVSCDPATLSRDLRMLVLRGFRVEDVQPVDMFPQTYHVESVTTLSRMGADDLLLASTSPRRRELLRELGLPFQALAPTGEEPRPSGEAPEDYVAATASAKAASVAEEAQTGVVVGADTVVVLDGEVLGKPTDADEARAMLRRLRNRPHHVITAVSVARAGSRTPQTLRNITTVHMRDYSDAEIEAYIATGDPFDKAGGYAIQHPDFRPVARIEGCYTNVVGLPLCTLSEGLALAGVTAPLPIGHAFCDRLASEAHVQ